MREPVFLIIADRIDFWTKFSQQFRSEGAVTIAEVLLIALLAAIAGAAAYWVRRSGYLETDELVDDPRRLLRDLRARHHLKRLQWRLLVKIAREQKVEPAVLFLQPAAFFSTPAGVSPEEAARRQALGAKLFTAELVDV